MGLSRQAKHRSLHAKIRGQTRRWSQLPCRGPMKIGFSRPRRMTLSSILPLGNWVPTPRFNHRWPRFLYSQPSVSCLTQTPCICSSCRLSHSRSHPLPSCLVCLSLFPSSPKSISQLSLTDSRPTSRLHPSSTTTSTNTSSPHSALPHTRSLRRTRVNLR